MSTVCINVGGKIFEATPATWSKSPTLDKLIQSTPESVFVDRSPAVFEHVLNWMRQGRLYIDRPDDLVYKQLCDDADFYGLEDLSRFLANRINLCSRVYFQKSVGERRFLCNLDGFRALEPADGFIDRLLAGEPHALADIAFVSPDTVLCRIDFSGCGNTVARPQWPWELDNLGRPAVMKMIVGSRFVEETGKPGSYRYRPVLRTEPKA